MEAKLEINMIMAGLGEYPDKIEGYHGCSAWRGGSSLKLRGNQCPIACNDMMRLNR